MKLTKFGHCCVLIEEQGVKILTDPGIFSTAQNETLGIDIVLITHEHSDHLHLESLKKVLKNNPNALVITNTSVGKILAAENITFQTLEHSSITTFKQIAIEALGNEHAEIYGSIGRVQNTGYFIAEKLFYPGDALYMPEKKVEILALPVAGPWIKIKEAIDYAKAVHPRVCFPVHDGIVKKVDPYHKTPKLALNEEGIEFIPMVEEDEREF